MGQYILSLCLCVLLGAIVNTATSTDHIRTHDSIFMDSEVDYDNGFDDEIDAERDNDTGDCGDLLPTEKKLFCYYRLNDSNLPLESLNPCLCTHLVCSSAIIRSDAIHGLNTVNLRKATALKAKNKNLKLLLDVDTFEFLLQDHENITHEFEKLSWLLLSVVRNESLDGLSLPYHIDVERNLDDLNGTANVLSTFIEFLRYAAETNDLQELIFTLRLTQNDEELFKDDEFKYLDEFVDFFLLPVFPMLEKLKSADQGLFGYSSDMESTEFVVRELIDNGVSQGKIILSLPVHGVVMMQNSSTNVDGIQSHRQKTLTYPQICSMVTGSEWKKTNEDGSSLTVMTNDVLSITYMNQTNIYTEAKYVMLRRLGGVSVFSINDDDYKGVCGNGSFSLLKTANRVLRKKDLELFKGTNNLLVEGESKLLQVFTSQDSTNNLYDLYPCKRNGYYRDINNCSRFYQCAKQMPAHPIANYAVFLFECPPGLGFDEEFQTCNFPSWSPFCEEGNEISPVPKSIFNCPSPGYHKDPEHCKWFYYCSDFGGRSLKAYEFRCPTSQLAFDAEKMLCNWKDLVPGCEGEIGKHKVHHRQSKMEKGFETSNFFETGSDANSNSFNSSQYIKPRPVKAPKNRILPLEILNYEKQALKANTRQQDKEDVYYSTKDGQIPGFIYITDINAQQLNADQINPSNNQHATVEAKLSSLSPESYNNPSNNPHQRATLEAKLSPLAPESYNNPSNNQHLHGPLKAKLSTLSPESYNNQHQRATVEAKLSPLFQEPYSKPSNNQHQRGPLKAKLSTLSPESYNNPSNNQHQWTTLEAKLSSLAPESYNNPSNNQHLHGPLKAKLSTLSPESYNNPSNNQHQRATLEAKLSSLFPEPYNNPSNNQHLQGPLKAKLSTLSPESFNNDRKLNSKEHTNSKYSFENRNFNSPSSEPSRKQNFDHSSQQNINQDNVRIYEQQKNGGARIRCSKLENYETAGNLPIGNKIEPPNEDYLGCVSEVSIAVHVPKGNETSGMQQVVKNGGRIQNRQDSYGRSIKDFENKLLSASEEHKYEGEHKIFTKDISVPRSNNPIILLIKLIPNDNKTNLPRFPETIHHNEEITTQHPFTENQYLRRNAVTGGKDSSLNRRQDELTMPTFQTTTINLNHDKSSTRQTYNTKPQKVKNTILPSQQRRQNQMSNSKLENRFNDYAGVLHNSNQEKPEEFDRHRQSTQMYNDVIKPIHETNSRYPIIESVTTTNYNTDPNQELEGIIPAGKHANEGLLLDVDINGKRQMSSGVLYVVERKRWENQPVFQNKQLHSTTQNNINRNDDNIMDSEKTTFNGQLTTKKFTLSNDMQFSTLDQEQTTDRTLLDENVVQKLVSTTNSGAFRNQKQEHSFTTITEEPIIDLKTSKDVDYTEWSDEKLSTQSQSTDFDSSPEQYAQNPTLSDNLQTSKNYEASRVQYASTEQDVQPQLHSNNSLSNKLINNHIANPVRNRFSSIREQILTQNKNTDVLIVPQNENDKQGKQNKAKNFDKISVEHFNLNMDMPMFGVRLNTNRVRNRENTVNSDHVPSDHRNPKRLNLQLNHDVMNNNDASVGKTPEKENLALNILQPSPPSGFVQWADGRAHDVVQGEFRRAGRHFSPEESDFPRKNWVVLPLRPIIQNSFPFNGSELRRSKNVDFQSGDGTTHMDSKPNMDDGSLRIHEGSFNAPKVKKPRVQNYNPQHRWNIAFVNEKRHLSVSNVACTREGLFYHPEDCSKFYECYWDQWLEKFTIHVFSCPVRLVFDERIYGCVHHEGQTPCVNT